MKNLIQNLSATLLHGASLKTDNLTPEERAIAYGVCRWHIQLEQQISELLHKPLKPKDQVVLVYLYIGAFQLRYSNTPDYAVINTLIDQIKKTPRRWASGLINKLLRTLAKQADTIHLASSLSLRTSHPQWMIDLLIDDYGTETATSILNANNQLAPMTLRINQQKTTRDAYLKLLADQGIEATACETSTAIQLTQPISVDRLPCFFEGFCSVQDESGQRVTEQLDLKPGMNVLDACSAPGSKAGHLLESEPTITLTACDVDAGRLQYVQENLDRLQLKQSQVTLKAVDATDIETWWDGTLFDRILIDAPCSGSGVIRRHPDIKICRRDTDINALGERQLGLLKALWPRLKPGGKLIYSTCSVFKAENNNVVERLCNTEQAAAITFQKQWLPEINGEDGFFIATILRQENLK